MRLLLINLSVRTISGGYEEYLKQFFARAEKEQEIDEILFIAVKAVTCKFRDRSKVRTLDLSPLSAFVGSVWHLQNKIASFRPDVIYVAMEKRCMGLSKLPVITMVQNMEPFVPPVKGNSILWRVVLRMMRNRAISAIRHSAHVITLSEFARQTVVNVSGISPAIVSNIPHGMARDGQEKPRKPASLDESLQFIFTAGSLSPARGLEDLIHAFISLKSKGALKGFGLCIAGSVHKYNMRWYQNLVEYISRAGLDDEVRWLGFLDRSEMLWCFRNARIFVITSRVESFCITAVANDVPVISTSCPCLPETLGEYAIYYKAGNWEQLAGHILDDLQAPSARVGPVPKSMITWDENFAKTLTVFNNLSEKKTSGT
jgi:glycosyltransferase involved in cell wall biosynthesis